MFIRFCLYLLLLAAACGCRNGQRQVQPAFYYWKSTYNISEAEKLKMQELGLQKLYIKFFDVDWNGEKPVPLADIHFAQKPQLPVVPVVFITNRTLQKITVEEAKTLAKNMLARINSQLKKYGLAAPAEIQFDCDWSVSTREKYFALLAEVKQLLNADTAGKPVVLSATIRLHQVKYAGKTGVPPADRGMLMFYNMGNVKDTSAAQNSVFDLETARKYLYNFDVYPLQLDVVLPLFRWAVVQRNGKVVALIADADAADLQQNPKLQQVSYAKFKVLENTFYKSHYLYRNDVLRTEGADLTTCTAAAGLIAPHIKSGQPAIAIYHWNDAQILQTSTDSLQEVYSRFY